MRADHLQIRHLIQHMRHTLRLAIGIAVIARMHQRGQAPLRHGAEHGHSAPVVQQEGLNIRVQLHAVQPARLDAVQLTGYILVVRMQRAKADQPVWVLGGYAHQVVVDGMHAAGRNRHAVHQKAGDARRLAMGHQLAQRPVQTHGNVVKDPGGLRRLERDGIRVNVRVCVNNRHMAAPLFSRDPHGNRPRPGSWGAGPHAFCAGW